MNTLSVGPLLNPSSGKPSHLLGVLHATWIESDAVSAWEPFRSLTQCEHDGSGKEMKGFERGGKEEKKVELKQTLCIEDPSFSDESDEDDSMDNLVIFMK